jgi:DNA-binding transcriptional regulator YdaS (Cro superfamily)
MNLHDYLADNRIEQKDFAAAIDVTPSFISHLALGKRKPSVDIAKRIEKATKGKVLAAVLLGLVDEKPKAKKAARK